MSVLKRCPSYKVSVMRELTVNSFTYMPVKCTSLQSFNFDILKTDEQGINSRNDNSTTGEG